MKRVCFALVALALALNAFAANPNLPKNNFAAFPTITIPVMANNPGAIAGTFYKTKVVILNPTNLTYAIQVTLYRDGQVAQRTINMAPGQVRNYDNFLEQIFAYAGAGSVVFDSWNVPNGSPLYEFIVSAEVYTDSPNGRFTTVVTSGALLDSISNFSEAFSLGLSVDDSRRTNIGAFNDSNSANAINADLYDASGNLLNTVPLNLNPKSWSQIPLQITVTNGYIKWRANGPAYCYAVAVDNQSNDGTFIPAAEFAP